ncbi:YbaB/EbfC family nucleoid-associated protein [Kaustia mangrovi]|uniref:Nucleoid-associated protein HW532_14810 n=1 Tax=Kaustia mangrovi TaxID=2593653 RepID=A0A7S8C5N4_9HYPH|nr:YbaB/EbfC family nucleoid-associated protein [Kaustia mangrovi]QPC43848.1 YbaB/EbfC family nucleoid-associated protein [Kaustia mangrovi]
MKDLGQMMKQMQEFQSRMQDMQAGLEELQIKGTAGGGMVTVTVNGKGAMMGVDIDASLLTGDEKEILEDLIVAAHGDARAKMEEAVAEEMKKITGGLPLPPGLNLGL